MARSRAGWPGVECRGHPEERGHQKLMQEGDVSGPDSRAWQGKRLGLVKWLVLLCLMVLQYLPSLPLRLLSWYLLLSILGMMVSSSSPQIPAYTRSGPQDLHIANSTANSTAMQLTKKEGTSSFYCAEDGKACSLIVRIGRGW